jgi:hypothetical protein
MAPYMGKQTVNFATKSKDNKVVKLTHLLKIPRSQIRKILVFDQAI